MRSSLFLTALCAATALAADVEKRSYKTEVVVVTITKTVYPGAPTAVPEPVNKGNPPVDNPPAPAPPKPDPKPDPPKPDPKPDPPKPDPKPDPPKQDPKPDPPKPAPQPQQPAPQPDPQPAPQPAPAPAPVSGYQATVLQQHNLHRANHSANALQWDEGLVSSASQLANSCVYGHNTYVF
jgi:outer membrane biosynthesis protein TonB